VSIVKLTVKQKAFSDYYIKLGNATQAYINAGYKASNRQVAEVNSAKLLTNHKVKDYIDERLAEVSSKRIASASEVLEYLTSVLRGESQSEIVVIEGEGDGCSIAKRMMKCPDEKEKLKAADSLAKRYGLNVQNINVTGSIPVVIKDDLDDDDE